MDHRVRALIKKNGLVFGMKTKIQNGFGLLEIVIFLAIFSILLSVAIPMAFRMMPHYERERFITQYNGLVLYAWNHALATHTVHRIYVDMKQKKITLEVPDGKQTKQAEPQFVPLEQGIVKNTVTIPDQLQIKQFFVKGTDEMARSAGGKSTAVWFFIDANGICQPVVINLVDTKDTIDGQPRQLGLVLNPFDAHFIVSDSFAKG